MRRKTFIHLTLALIAVGVTLAGCKNAGEELKQVAGTLEGPVPSNVMPDPVQQAFVKAVKYHSCTMISATLIRRSFSLLA